ncbi:hypothetical protein CEXT_778391 [Caerostris extrusa]|uniref:Uncharacterized protein n=1 Tax=Caerostris extrusa TaxID=172846 RepID=A0AAV4VSC0_CAEEX|nr:hypothetical protein CEXT_778391 [Caerostris extrusa]
MIVRQMLTMSETSKKGSPDHFFVHVAGVMASLPGQERIEMDLIKPSEKVLFSESPEITWIAVMEDSVS